uniref:hypothetical protein n=1 Tax=Pseudomonas sp. RL_105y_Pfl2_101 TaxID=3088708 RepID=UPI0030DAC819
VCLRLPAYSASAKVICFIIEKLGDWCPVILPNQEVFFRVSLGYGGYEELRSQAKQNGPAYSGQSLAIEQFIAPISLRISRYWSVSAERAEHVAAALGLMHLDAFRPTVRTIQQPLMREDRVSPPERLPNLGLSPRPIFDAVRHAALMPMAQIEALQDAMRSMVHMAALQEALKPSAQMAAIQDAIKPSAQMAAQMAAFQDAIKPSAQMAAQMAAIQDAIKPSAQMAAQMAAIQDAIKPPSAQMAAQMAAIQDAIKPSAQMAAQMAAIQDAMKPMAHIAAILDALKSTPH